MGNPVLIYYIEILTLIKIVKFLLNGIKMEDLYQPEDGFIQANTVQM